MNASAPSCRAPFGFKISILYGGLAEKNGLMMPPATVSPTSQCSCDSSRRPVSLEVVVVMEVVMLVVMEVVVEVVVRKWFRLRKRS